MKTFMYWVSKLTLIFMIFFLSTTTWILTHPFEGTIDGMLVYPSAIFWHIAAAMIFMPVTYISHIVYRDNYSEGEQDV